MIDAISFAAAIILLVPGVLMALIPMLPAVPYMFVVALAFAFVGGFERLSLNESLVLLGIAALSIAVDQASGILGAKYGGAHGRSVLWGIIGALAGALIFPPFGSLVGLFAAILIAELRYKKTRGAALRAASGALVGTAFGVVVNVALALIFIAVFAYLALG